MGEIVNKIQQSRLKTLDLEQLLEGEEIGELDIKQFLFKEMILREEEFREYLKTYDWSCYNGRWVAVYCSTDAIVPPWAWMLVTTYLTPVAKEVVYGNTEKVYEAILFDKIRSFDWSRYQDEYVLLKGCSKAKVPAAAYLEATKKLLSVVGKLMYGEACSNVPVYRRGAQMKSGV